MAEHLDALAAKRMAWMGSLSDEDKQKLVAEKGSWESEDTKAERMQEMQATFQAADTNEDGVLNQAEFVNFVNSMNSNLTARGVPNMGFDGDEDQWYALYNAESGDQDGVTVANFFSCTKKLMAKARGE